MILASEASPFDLVKANVISSRIRLARNVRGVPFPKNAKGYEQELLEIVKGAAVAAHEVFDESIYLIGKLEKPKKKALIERHIISLALANNLESGAVIVEKGENNISIMVNEEDHIREQCVMDGFCLEAAYVKLDRYDDELAKHLPIAYDEEIGFLTSCPTNVGTGMRASCMVFLPALKRMNAIDDALKRFKEEYDLTIRGVYGEGSDSFCDMYQISNNKTLGLTEQEIIEKVKDATIKLCYLERIALERLIERDSATILDKISRSYAILSTGAMTLSAEELIDLIVYVKMGIIMEVLPKKLDVRMMDKLSQYVSPSTFEITNPNSTQQEQDVLRAQIVKRVFAETVL